MTSSASGRDAPLAAALSNGEILVAGTGPDGTKVELYDPVTGTWSETGTMKSDHGGGTATLLPDGKVLAVGGGVGLPEVYDPGTGAWSETTQTTLRRHRHSATLLSNGKVLVAGGLGGSLGTRSAELFNPRTRSWEATGSMLQIRYEHAAVRLRDGTVLVAGGWSENYGANNTTAEVFDPQKGTWAPTGPVPYNPVRAAAAELADGRVLLVGGTAAHTHPGGVERAALFDPKTREWTATASLRAARDRHTATPLLSGQVLVAGGMGHPAAQHVPASTELYDPQEGTWAPGPPMKHRRTNHVAVLLDPRQRGTCGALCGNVLVAGGGSSEAELYESGPAAAEGTGRGRVASDRARKPGNDGEDSFRLLLVAALGVVVVSVGIGVRRRSRRG